MIVIVTLFTGTNRFYLVHVVVGQQEGGCDLVTASPDVSLLAQEAEAGHGHEDGLHVDGPEVHEVDDLQLDMSLSTDGYL